MDVKRSYRWTRRRLGLTAAARTLLNSAGLGTWPAHAATEAELADWLHSLQDCAAETGRQAENAAPSRLQTRTLPKHAFRRPQTDNRNA